MHMNRRGLALAIAGVFSAQAFTHAAGADAAVQGKPRPASGVSHDQPHFKYPNRSHPTVGTVLYDQSGTAENGAPVQNFQSAFSAFDAQGADDFIVTDAAGWDVSGFNFQVAFIDQNGQPAQPPASIVYAIDVYADAGGAPGAASCSYPSVTGALNAGARNLSIALPAICSLTQGAYWVSMTPVFDYPPQSFWSNASGAAIGSAGVWRNPSGGFGTACSSWSELSMCITSSSFSIGGGNPNYLFQVIGAVGGGGCDPSGICLTSTVGTDTSPGACGASHTIDATVGDQLNFCYTITNNTGIELDYQTLQNNIDGTLFFEMQRSDPGRAARFSSTISRPSAQTNAYNSTWTAQDIRSGYVAEVESGGGNCADRIFADGFENRLARMLGANNFVDIAGTGLALGLSDDGTADVSMPFSFNFYGTTSNDADGLEQRRRDLQFAGRVPRLPQPITSAPATSQAPRDSAAVGRLRRHIGRCLYGYAWCIAESPVHRRVVQSGPLRGAANTDGATFELILNEDGTLQFEYADVGYSAFGNAQRRSRRLHGRPLRDDRLAERSLVCSSQYSAFAGARSPTIPASNGRRPLRRFSLRAIRSRSTSARRRSW